jgi:hypothetical protein
MADPTITMRLLLAGTSAIRKENSTYALWRSNGRAYTIVSRLVYRSSEFWADIWEQPGGEETKEG